MKYDPISFFIKGSRLSLISLLILILAGGIVRSSGSGMGCPDWPKCFNRWVPPTDKSELPSHFKEEYLSKRIKKNNRLSELLFHLGYKDLAGKMKGDPDIFQVEEFNAFNTWAEYINRLIGAITGLFFLGLFVLSISLFSRSPLLFWLSGTNLVLIFFQAYLGSLVVSTHLLPGLISLHMLLAVFILFILLWNMQWAQKIGSFPEFTSSPEKLKFLKPLLLLVILITLIQILLGSSVRESFDTLGTQFQTESEFLYSAGKFFPVHRIFSLLILGINGYLAYRVYALRKENIKPFREIYWSLILVLIQMGFGISLELGHLPPFSQALHVFLAFVLFSTEVWSWFLLGLFTQHKVIMIKSV